MPAMIAASAVRTCFGSGADTFAALLRGDCGVAPLALGDGAPGKLNITRGYHCPGGDPDRPGRAGDLLTACVQEAAVQAALDPARARVAVLAGTGLRELAAVEHRVRTGAEVPARSLHFGDAVRAALPGATESITVSNACSAGGHVLALAEDLLAEDEADAVVVGAADSMTRSMLAMIGQVAPEPTERVRPFDRDRDGVLLGEGAAAVVLVPETWPGPRLARVAGTGLSCDAHHHTAPDVGGIRRSMAEAYERAGREPADTGLVVAHGTGTALNDPAECAALRAELLEAGGAPLVTAVKGAVGHTSGAAALINLDVAVRCLRGERVPPVVGLRHVLDEGAGLRFVREIAALDPATLVQLNAFGFGGVNAVTLLEAA